MLRSCLAISKGIKATYVRLKIFLLSPVSALNTIHCCYTIKLCQKQLWRNLALMNLKLKKFTIFYSEFNQFYSISIFHVGGCLASCLTFTPFLTTLDPS